MIPTVADRTDELKSLCHRHGVQRLDLFGSAATGQHHEKSDLDFVVDFKPEAIVMYANSYFGLLEGLEQLFGKPVDLVIRSAIENPYFLQSIEETRKLIYEA